ncbi:MAG: metal-dependent hydrolase [Myxococcota bacterium]
MTVQASQLRPDGVNVTYRRMRFDFEEGFDRYWHGGSAFRSLFWTQLSTAFQPGERFFIDSARALKGTLDDPAQLEELVEFCKQEGHHTAQHLAFDRMNAAKGIDIDGCRDRYTWWLDLGRRVLGPYRQLGITCALEHFTSSLADRLFAVPEMTEGADPRVLALWTWHAIEEAEHRGTCHDVFVAAGGSYFTRVSTLFTAWGLILAVSLVNTFRLLWQDGQLFTRDTWRGLGYLFGRRGIVTGLFPVFLRYFRPGFHPWQEPVVIDGDVIAQWQVDNARHIIAVGSTRAMGA